jgi:hypothetical protein
MTSEELLQLMTLAKKVETRSTKTGRGVLTQIALIIPSSQEQECLKIVDFLPKKEKYIVTYKNETIPLQFATKSKVTNIKIVETRVYETRLVSLDEPDPRRVSIAKKRLNDSRDGKLPGVPTILMEEKLKDILQTPLRKFISKSIHESLISSEKALALAALSKAQQVLISNFESAPLRLRMTWKDENEVPKSKTLSAGVTIIFEDDAPPSNSGWVKKMIDEAKKQGAWVDGYYFPRMP